MYQKVIIAGNLGQDPEMRFAGEKPVTNMSVAVNRAYTNANGVLVKETIWFKVSVWGKQAEACQKYLSKGRQVIVEGELVADENGNPRTFQRKDGTSGASFELRANSVRFIGGSQQAGGQAEDDDLPF